MAGQTVKGQLLTRVRLRPGFVALVRVQRISNVVVKNRVELEAIFECVRENVKGLVGFYRLVGKTGKTRLPLTDSLLFFFGQCIVVFLEFYEGFGWILRA